jgi:hypothetical protein
MSGVTGVPKLKQTDRPQATIRCHRIRQQGEDGCWPARRLQVSA